MVKFDTAEARDRGAHPPAGTEGSVELGQAAQRLSPRPLAEGAPMTVIDPVCGMEVDPATAEWKTEYQGHTYYFCAPGCQRSFEKDPQKYLASGEHNQADHDHDMSAPAA